MTDTTAGAPRVPKASVIIPTFNRAPLLAETLRGLARQHRDPDDFEVVVIDDGSTDATPEVVKSFEDRLHLSYAFQEDRGFRVAEARNRGARLATSDTLVFVDTGAVVGPDFLSAHLKALGDGGRPRAVVGYAYAYRPEDPTSGLAEMSGRVLPERLPEVYRHDPSFWDNRHGTFMRCDWDLQRLTVPWFLLWATNCSMRTDLYWAVNGFDEDFQRWGVEDMELGLRLFKHGVEFVVSHDAWAVETPHERDAENNTESNNHNIAQMHDKHPEPVVEIGWDLIRTDRYWHWEDDYRRVLQWTDEVRDRDVSDEIAAAVAGLGDTDQVAVIGCGGRVPESLKNAQLFDFDPDHARAHGDAGRHAIGMRTRLPDRSVDVVVLTSRLSGLWERWNLQILAEARRIGLEVRAPGLEPW